MISNLKFVGLVDYPAGASFGPRHMRDFEFVWIVAGDCLYTVDDQAVPCPANTVVLCRPGCVDSFTWDPDKPTRHAYFHFDLRRAPSHWPDRHDWPIARQLTERDIVLPMFRYMLNCDRSLWPLSAEHMLTAWVLGQTQSREVAPAAHAEPVARALDFIHKHVLMSPERVLTLHDLADAALVTPEHLCRLFKSATGRSPVETVRLARLDRALELLARSNYSIAQIAHRTGFASPFHFSRTFKSAFGKSPMQIRTGIKSGQNPPVPVLVKRVYAIR
jgi:AraC family transcriptional regulator